jgi:hypothetical protein
VHREFEGKLDKRLFKFLLIDVMMMARGIDTFGVG